jgi:N utilization substance protein B
VKHPNSPARQFSFQFLFHLQFEEFQALRKELIHGVEVDEALLKDYLKAFEVFHEEELSTKAYQLCLDLIKGVLLHYEAIERIIDKYLKNWKLERLSKVDHAILLQGVCELLTMGENPKNVVIDESIELAKRFGGSESAAFINGVLDKVANSGDQF